MNMIMISPEFTTNEEFYKEFGEETLKDFQLLCRKIIKLIFHIVHFIYQVKNFIMKDISIMWKILI